MNPNTIREMEPHIRQRFHFAWSSFSRIYGVSHVTGSMIDFCHEWATQDEKTPLDCLYNVDRYFKEKWDTLQQQH